MKKDIRLYNVLFPIWFLFLFPQLWLIMLPINFLVDSLVILISARCQKLERPGSIWKQGIVKVWLIGFLCDLLGAGLTVLLYFGWCALDAMDISLFNPILFPGTTLLAIPGTILAGVLIYRINKRFSFRRLDLDASAIRALCLHLAIFTAPYTMLIPLYG